MYSINERYSTLCDMLEASHAQSSPSMATAIADRLVAPCWRDRLDKETDLTSLSEEELKTMAKIPLVDTLRTEQALKGKLSDFRSLAKHGDAKALRVVDAIRAKSKLLEMTSAGKAFNDAVRGDVQDLLILVMRFLTRTVYAHCRYAACNHLKTPSRRLNRRCLIPQLNSHHQCSSRHQYARALCNCLEQVCPQRSIFAVARPLPRWVTRTSEKLFIRLETCNQTSALCA